MEKKQTPPTATKKPEVKAAAKPMTAQKPSTATPPKGSSRPTR